MATNKTKAERDAEFADALKGAQAAQYTPVAVMTDADILAELRGLTVTNQATLIRATQLTGAMAGKSADGPLNVALACAKTARTAGIAEGAGREIYLAYAGAWNDRATYQDKIDLTSANDKSIGANGSKIGAFIKLGLHPAVTPEWPEKMVRVVMSVDKRAPAGIYEASLKVARAQVKATTLLTDDEVRRLVTATEKAEETFLAACERIAEAFTNACKKHGPTPECAQVSAALNFLLASQREQNVKRERAVAEVAMRTATMGSGFPTGATPTSPAEAAKLMEMAGAAKGSNGAAAAH